MGRNDKYKFDVEEVIDENQIVVVYDTLRGLMLSDIPECLLIITHKDGLRDEVCLGKTGENKMNIEIRETMRKKFWEPVISVEPFMQIQKKVIESMIKQGFKMKITSFKLDNLDDYNDFYFQVELEGSCLDDILSQLEDMVAKLDLDVYKVYSDIELYIHNKIESL